MAKSSGPQNGEGGTPRKPSTGGPARPGKPAGTQSPPSGPRPASGKGSGSAKGSGSGSGSAKSPGPAKTSPSAKSPGSAKTSGSARTSGSAKGRASVAAARRTKPGSNRTQLIIGGIAVLLIIGVVVLGIVLNRKQTAVPDDGYGTSQSSVATAADGVITFTNGSPGTTIDVFEDALCPICGEFEHQFGQQMTKAVDDGSLAIRLRMLTFLNQSSASKDYSTRAYAALLTVVDQAGQLPGVALRFHSALYDPANQPKEGASSDLTNEQLADLAVKAGAPETVRAAIIAGAQLDAAKAGAAASTAALKAATGRVGTPTVLKNNAPVDINDVDWLTNLLASSKQ